MESDEIERLVTQSRSNDVDARVDAVAKLQLKFEAATEINDPDGVLNALKSCLRTPNQHLQTATLSALPPLISHLLSRPIAGHPPRAATPSSSSSSAAHSPAIDVYTLRQLLIALLPSGGVIDRLGDSRERARDKARETLALLGGYAFRSSRASASAMSKSREGKGPETPMTLFERLLREVGLASKVWRVREQSILTLVNIRRKHHSFPIRPYLPLLISSLEDTDSNVRECARDSVVELFTGPGVTDAARADLKKELAKKGVRKQIADGVLNRVLAAASAANTPLSESAPSLPDDGDAPRRDYIPPSMKLTLGKQATIAGSSNGHGPAIARSVSHAVVGTVTGSSRPPSRSAFATAPSTPTATESSTSAIDIKTVYLASDRDLENEFATMLKSFEGKETEHNWAGRDRGITRVRGMIKGDVHVRFPGTFFANLKTFLEASLKTLASLRTTVAANTCLLYNELAAALGTTLDPFCEPLFTHLANMSGMTKKIMAQQSQSTFDTLIKSVSALPRTVVPLLWQLCQDKNMQCRLFGASHVKFYIDAHGVLHKHALEVAGAHDTLDKAVRKVLADPNVGVRENARSAFWAFEAVWPERAAVIMHALDATAQKQLQKACPDPHAAAALTPATSAPKEKKSSVAAAIAASRAKARAIANAPPTLMHQATSASHAMRAVSPPMSRRPASPSLSNRSASSTGASNALSSPKSRLTAPQGQLRSVSASALPATTHTRSASASSPPGSPTSGIPRSRRTPSSTYAPDKSLYAAMSTALPPSPPGKTLLRMPNIGRSPQRTSFSALLNEPPPHRPTVSLDDDDSLLLATQIPIPEESDSDDDPAINPLSLSTPSRARAQAQAVPRRSEPSSYAPSFSPKSDGSMRPMLSDPHGATTSSDAPIVEDAMRARAEQAESAAERLLELVDPEEDGAHHSTIPRSLLVNGSATPKPKAARAPAAVTPVPGLGLASSSLNPVTPVNRNAAILRQAAAFKESPVFNGKTGTSLLDVLQDRKHETGWWLKRMSLIKQDTPLKSSEPADLVLELQDYITALEKGLADTRTLQKIALLSIESPVADPDANGCDGNFSDPQSPFLRSNATRTMPSLDSDIWSSNRNFDRLFDALMKYLEPTQEESDLEYALIVLWELLENQGPNVEGHEAEIFSALFRVRYCNKTNVLEATNTIRDALAARGEPVYGLTTMHASLRVFLAEPPHSSSDEHVKASTYAFGLIALGKFIVRLPSEVLEEELPRLRATLISALSDTSSLLVRESAAASIIAAQLVLRDETHLFSLLEGLADEKKNLLTYLFDKHGARGTVLATGTVSADKLEREMRRLDTRTSTPPRAPRVRPV